MKEYHSLHALGNGAVEISHSSGSKAIRYNTKDLVGFVNDVVVFVKTAHGYVWEDDDKEKVALVMDLLSAFGWKP